MSKGSKKKKKKNSSYTEAARCAESLKNSRVKDNKKSRVYKEKTQNKQKNKTQVKHQQKTVSIEKKKKQKIVSEEEKQEQEAFPAKKKEKSFFENIRQRFEKLTTEKEKPEALSEEEQSPKESSDEKLLSSEEVPAEKKQRSEEIQEEKEKEPESFPEESIPEPKKIFRREEEPGQEKEKRKGVRIPSGLLIIFTFLYWEILFKLITVRCNDIADWMLTVAMISAFGLLMSAIVSLAGEKAGAVLTIVIEALAYFIFTGQYVHYLFYSSFFSLFSLLSGTGQVAQFAESIFKVMAGKALNIFLLTFPLLLSVILIARKVVEFRRRKVWIAIATSVSVLVFVLLPKSLNKDDSRMYSPYKVYYEINSPFYSVRYFGLAEMMTKDVYRYLTGFEEKTVIIVPSGTEFIGDDEKEYNVTDIDFSGMSASESRETIAAMHKYFASVEPTEKNDYTGIFEGKNLIYIVAEALCYGGIDPDMTPTLYKMTTEGINFTNYYSPLYYASTFDGEYMTLLSLIPSDGEWSLYTARNNSLPYSYGNAFRKLGYRSEAYHGWWYDYYYRDETHPNLGYVWNAVGSGLDVDANYWPPSDVEVVEKSVPEYISDSPFMVYYLSISGHLGYTFSGNTMSTKHKSEVADLPYSEPVRAYYACQKEFDDSLALLLKDLEEQGILDDTVIVISNDHYPYGLMTDEMEEFCDYIEDEKFDIHKGVFLIYNSATDGEQVDTVCSSLDALPTVSNMFGLEYDSRLVMGTDVMSEKEPVAIFSDRSWKTSSGTYDASTETFRKARLAEIDSNYIDTIKNRVYYAFLMSKYILEYDYYRLVS